MRTDEPRPLPECALCAAPTQRRAHRANRGMCTACRTAYDLDHAEQLRLPVVVGVPAPRPPDLSNVVVLATRRRP